MASVCNKCRREASYLESSVLTWNISLGTIMGANAEMVVVTVLRSDVYHVLHMYHVLLKVTVIF